MATARGIVVTRGSVGIANLNVDGYKIAPAYPEEREGFKA